MATIKSYTDIEQSKKLAKILPIESADMIYPVNFDFPFIWIEKPEKDKDTIPCWSLAALLEIFPKGYSAILSKSFNGKNYFCIIDGKPIETIADNPVDACMAMIEKLHELKML